MNLIHVAGGRWIVLLHEGSARSAWSPRLVPGVHRPPGYSSVASACLGPVPSRRSGVLSLDALSNPLDRAAVLGVHWTATGIRREFGGLGPAEFGGARRG